LLGRVRPRYGERLQARYKLPELAVLTDEALLAEIGRRRGGLLRGGQVNLQKAGDVVLNDFRSGAWGRITLETPEQFSQWCAAGREREAMRQARPPRRGQSPVPAHD
jgi:ribosome biogenesis GTPase A